MRKIQAINQMTLSQFVVLLILLLNIQLPLTQLVTRIYQSKSRLNCAMNSVHS